MSCPHLDNLAHIFHMQRPGSCPVWFWSGRKPETRNLVERWILGSANLNLCRATVETHIGLKLRTMQYTSTRPSASNGCRHHSPIGGAYGTRLPLSFPLRPERWHRRISYMDLAIVFHRASNQNHFYAAHLSAVMPISHVVFFRPEMNSEAFMPNK